MAGKMISRLMGLTAGLLGAAGVAAAAAAAHGGYSDSLRVASEFALIHAALAMALLRGAGRLSQAAVGVILLGALFFCGDLALRALAGRGLFPMAAPAGGFLMIGGWLLSGLAMLLKSKPA